MYLKKLQKVQKGSKRMEVKICETTSIQKKNRKNQVQLSLTSCQEVYPMQNSLQ